MGYMSYSPPFADFDGDGTRDGILRQLNVGTGLTGSLINGVLSLEVTGGQATVFDGTITLTAGTNMTGGGDFTTNQNIPEEITFSGLSNAQIQALITGTSPISVSSGVVSFTGGLNDLSDVTITTPEEGNSLFYNGTNWVNSARDQGYIRVKNDTLSTLNKGLVVYISGPHNANLADVELARANSASTMPAIGVLYQDLSPGDEGLAIAYGRAAGLALPSPTFSEGDTVYVSTSVAGGVTNTKPTGASDLIQNVGIVMKTHATNGVLFVTGVGRSNDVPNSFSIAGDITTTGDVSGADGTFTGDFSIGGKLTVTGLIDPTGLELTPVSANPGGVAANTIWQDSANSNQWKIGANRVVDSANLAGLVSGAGFVTDISGFDTDDLSEGTTNRYFANSLARSAISVGTPAAASGSGSISYVSGTGVLTYTPPDLSSYLTSFTEANDLTAAVTWANVPDANITESSVTQHQAALSLTKSQITDFGSYQAPSDILTDLAGLTQAADKLPYFDSTTTAATTTLTSFARTLLDDADAASVRSTLGVDAAGADNSTDVTLATVADNYLTIAGQVITAGIVPVSLGGTGSSTASGARIALGLGTAATTDSGDYATAAQGSKADTAHAWGDHGAVGYLTSETYTGTVTSVAATVPTGFTIGGSPITTTGTLALGFAAGYSLPTTTKQGQWDTAYGWGDHSLVGYLTAETSHADVLVDGDFASAGLMATDGSGGYSIVADASANWNTAFGWGNHATAGYLTSYTEAQTLDDVVTLGSSTTQAIVVGGLTVDTNTLAVDTNNNRVGIGTSSPKTAITVEGSVTLKEQAAADTDTAAYGQIWVKTGTPNELYFTNDAGTDIRLDSETDSVVGAINGLVKSDGGGNISAAVPDTDYQSVLAEGAFVDGDKAKLDAIEASATADQDADEVSVAATPSNYTAATADVEAHLAGIDAELANKLGSASDLDISALTANTAIADADLLLLDDGANGTNRKITFTEVKEWIRGEGVIVGRDGGVNELRIRDSRDDGDVSPNDFPDKTVSFDFTDDITGSPNTWDSVITMKGWSDNYRAWQIFSSSASGSQSVDEVPLFFRSGEEDVQAGWGETKEILTFPGTAPRVDGSANQILQTDGAGTLSWVDHLSVTEATVKSAIDGMTLSDIGTPASTDRILVQDASDSNNLKYADFSEFGGGGGGTPSGVAGAVQFSDGSAFASDDTNLHWDDTNNRLGIGTNAPEAALNVVSAATGNIFVLECTDNDTDSGPDISMIRDSSSPAIGDFLGRIVFKGRDSGGNLHEYGNIKAQLGDPTNGGEDFNMFFQGIIAGTNRSFLGLRGYGGIAGTGQAEVCINENSIDMDFRVESDNKTSALFVRGSDGNVGIGTTSPAQELHVAGTIRQTGAIPTSPATSAVLVADSNGDITAATNLSDVSYYQTQPPLPPGPLGPPGIGNWHDPINPGSFVGWIALGAYYVPAFQ